MNKKSFLSNVQMAEYILSRNRSTIKNQKSTPLSSVIFRSVDGVEHRIDISGAKTIYELSAVLKRADIDANVLLIKQSENIVKILNLTQHPATPEQIAQGVVDPVDHAAIKAALTFDTLPTSAVLFARAETLAMFAVQQGCKTAMIGGAPYFMAPLEMALWARRICAVYAYSVRETEEQAQPDGSVRKVAVFRHAGFVGMEFAELPSP